MASESKTPPIFRACIAVGLIAGIAVCVIAGVCEFFHSLMHPQPEPEYIYEPKSVRK